MPGEHAAPITTRPPGVPSSPAMVSTSSVVDTTGTPRVRQNLTVAACRRDDRHTATTSGSCVGAEVDTSTNGNRSNQGRTAEGRSVITVRRDSGNWRRICRAVNRPTSPHPSTAKCGNLTETPGPRAGATQPRLALFPLRPGFEAPPQRAPREISRIVLAEKPARSLALSSTYFVGLAGIEPATSPLSGVRSNRLSYSPIVWARRQYCSAQSTHNPIAGRRSFGSGCARRLGGFFFDHADPNAADEIADQVEQDRPDHRCPGHRQGDREAE